MMREFLKVGISGVRGVVGQSFTPQLATAFAKAFGMYAGRGNVLVGRDTRPSGHMFELAVTAGLQSVGCRPVLAGIVPTPTLLHLARDKRARGGIMITASHNAAPWNALKFVDGRGMFLSPDHAEELYDIYHQGAFAMVPEPELPDVIHIQDPCRDHVARVLEYVDVEAIRSRSFKVAVDCCNGVGALHTRRFLEQLGCEVHTCLDTATGVFEREPEPRPENLDVLSRLVGEAHCDVGFAQDPDGDRLAILDEAGTPLGEDATVALTADQVLSAHQQGPLAVSLSTSRLVDAVARKHGVEITKTRIGEIHVAEAMLAVGAVAGGEGNGGAIVPAIHPCRDSYAGMALILELMARSGQAVSTLRAQLPESYMLKDKLRIRAGDGPEILRAIRRKYEGCDLILLDGVYVQFEDGWLHARLSNTEPVLRLCTEAATAARARELMDDVCDQAAASIPQARDHFASHEHHQNKKD
jgi:phosphomannomutase